MTSLIEHHPHEDLLLALCAGTLDSGGALVVAAHVERCVHCQRTVRELEAVGGALLEAASPESVAPEALARTLARLDSPPTTVSRTSPALKVGAQLPVGLTWPRSMRGCAITHWRWIGPGMHWSRVTLPHDPAANVFLLRIAAGKFLPAHTHSEVELTQVLYGNFHDGRALFGPGDFDEADRNVHHQPIVQAGGECICLASVKGKVVFDGAIARVLGSLVGM